MKLKKLTIALIAAGVIMTSAGVYAANTTPSGKVSGNSVTISNAYNDDVIKSLTPASKIAPANLMLSLREINNDDLAKIVKAFPKVKNLVIDSKALTSVDALNDISVSVSLRIKAPNVANFNVLSKFTNIKQLGVDSDSMDNLKWMAPLTNLTSASIHGSFKLSSIEGIPANSTLKELALEHLNLVDLNPVVVLGSLEKLELDGSNIKDLTPLNKLNNLKKLDLKSANVADFTPLGTVPNLKQVSVYASKSNNYNALGELKQVEKIESGMTSMNDISWLKNDPKLTYLGVFSENITDYSPVVGSTIKEFKIWSMKSPVDLSQLKGATNLEKLIMHSCTKNAPITHTEALGTLSNLQTLDFISWKSCGSQLDGSFAKGLSKLEVLTVDDIPDFINVDNLGELTALQKIKLSRLSKTIDLSFMGKLTNLKTVELSKITVSNFDVLSNCGKLEYLDISKAEGVTSLKALKALPNLKNLVVKKGSFPEDELKGFANAKISQR